MENNVLAGKSDYIITYFLLGCGSHQFCCVMLCVMLFIWIYSPAAKSTFKVERHPLIKPLKTNFVDKIIHFIS